MALSLPAFDGSWGDGAVPRDPGVSSIVAARSAAREADPLDAEPVESPVGKPNATYPYSVGWNRGLNLVLSQYSKWSPDFVSELYKDGSKLTAEQIKIIAEEAQLAVQYDLPAVIPDVRGDVTQTEYKLKNPGTMGNWVINKLPDLHVPLKTVVPVVAPVSTPPLKKTLRNPTPSKGKTKRSTRRP